MLPSTVTSDVNLSSDAAIEKILIAEKEQANEKPTSKPKSGWGWNWRLTPKADEPQTSDPEKDGPAKRDPRPIRLYAPFYCGISVALALCRTLRSVLFLVSLSHLFSLLREWSRCLARGVGFRQ